MWGQRLWKAVLIGLLVWGLWLYGCGQQEGPVEKVGKEIDQTIEKVADTMEEAKDNLVDTAEDLADEVKEVTEKE